jgi:hypothetical protein
MNGIMRKVFVTAIAGLMLVALACVSGTSDDPSTPDVVLQVTLTDSPAVTAQDQAGICVIRVQEWTVTFNNVPKNSLATTSPFNDVYVAGYTLEYTFPDVAVTWPTRSLPIQDPITVPANSQAEMKFFPILLQDIVNNPQVLGSSGIGTITFHASMEDGKRWDKAVGEVLFVEQCVSGG